MNSPPIDHVKFLRPKQIYPRHSRLRKITSLLRIVELFLFLIMVSRFLFQFPTDLKIYLEYFHDLNVFFISPSFVFIVGNAIVIVLFTKSRGSLTQSSPSSEDVKAETYQQEYINQKQGKTRTTMPEQDTNHVMAGGFLSSLEKIYQQQSEESFSELRGWRLEKATESFDYCKETSYVHYSEDHMTNEEFNQAIDAFIARQQKLLREEVVSYPMKRSRVM